MDCARERVNKFPLENECERQGGRRTECEWLSEGGVLPATETVWISLLDLVFVSSSLQLLVNIMTTTTSIYNSAYPPLAVATRRLTLSGCKLFQLCSSSSFFNDIMNMMIKFAWLQAYVTTKKTTTANVQCAVRKRELYYQSGVYWWMLSGLWLDFHWLPVLSVGTDLCAQSHFRYNLQDGCVTVKPQLKAGEFSSPGSTFCADSYFSIHSTPMLLQYYIKDPGHSAKSAGGRLQLNMHASYIYGFK